MEDLYNDQGELSGLPHDDQPGRPKNVKPIFEEDIVPSLAPDWKPPTFSQEMKFFDDVAKFNEEKDLNEEVSLM